MMVPTQSGTRASRKLSQSRLKKIQLSTAQVMRSESFKRGMTATSSSLHRSEGQAPDDVALHEPGGQRGEQEGEEELVPHPDQAEHGGHRQPGLDQGEDDLAEDLHAPVAVDHRRLLDLLGHLVAEAV